MMKPTTIRFGATVCYINIMRWHFETVFHIYIYMYLLVLLLELKYPFNAWIWNIVNVYYVYPTGISVKVLY